MVVPDDKYTTRGNGCSRCDDSRGCNIRKNSNTRNLSPCSDNRCAGRNFGNRRNSSGSGSKRSSGCDGCDTCRSQSRRPSRETRCSSGCDSSRGGAVSRGVGTSTLRKNRKLTDEDCINPRTANKGTHVITVEDQGVQTGNGSKTGKAGKGCKTKQDNDDTALTRRWKDNNRTADLIKKLEKINLNSCAITVDCHAPKKTKDSSTDPAPDSFNSPRRQSPKPAAPDASAPPKKRQEPVLPQKPRRATGGNSPIRENAKGLDSPDGTDFEDFIDRIFKEIRDTNPPIVWIYGYTQSNVESKKMTSLNLISKAHNLYTINLSREIDKWSALIADKSVPPLSDELAIAKRAYQVFAKVVEESATLTTSEICNLFKYAIVSSALNSRAKYEGFIFDEFPLTVDEGDESEQMIMASAVGLYFVNSQCSGQKNFEPEVLFPKYLLRSHKYVEHDVNRAADHFGFKTIKVINAEELDEVQIRDISKLVKEHLDGRGLDLHKVVKKVPKGIVLSSAKTQSNIIMNHTNFVNEGGTSPIGSFSANPRGNEAKESAPVTSQANPKPSNEPSETKDSLGSSSWTTATETEEPSETSSAKGKAKANA